MSKYSGLVMIMCVLLLSACDKSNPGQGQKGLFLPPVGFKSNAAQGEALYHDACAHCHGKQGMGSNSGPPLIHKIYEPSHHGDLAFYRAVNKGVQSHHWKFGNMPPVPGVTAEQTAHIVAYIRREQRKAGIR